MERTKRKVSIIIALVMLVFFIAGCDLAGGGPSAKLSPPSWIRGAWKREEHGLFLSSLVFSSDNVIWQTHTPGGLGFDFKGMGENEGISITEDVVSDTVYRITVRYSESARGTQVFTFTKKSAGLIYMRIVTGGHGQEIGNFIRW